LVVRHYSGDEQIGGSLFVDGLATRCLPQDSGDVDSSALLAEIEDAFFEAGGVLSDFATEVTQEDLGPKAKVLWNDMEMLFSDAEPFAYEFQGSRRVYLVMIFNPDTFHGLIDVVSAEADNSIE